MKTKGRILLVTFLLVLMLTHAAFARLAAVGPLHPATGFPQYYVDPNGVAIELTVPPFGTPAGGGVVTPPTMVFDPVDPLNDFSVTVGFGTEAFYYVCDAANFTSPFGNIVFRTGLEAAFANEVATNGQQSVFSRLRIVFVNAPVPGVYTLSHPYGTDSITVTADDIASGKGLKLTRDIGAAPLDFTTALNGDVGPFLKQVAPIVITPGTPAQFSVGWVGDGVTVSTITGSPIAFNKVRLTGPAGSNIGGPGVDFVETTQFVVSGHRFAGKIPTPLTVSAVTYSRNAIHTYFDVFASSAVGGVARTKINTSTFTMVPGINEESGLFFKRVHFFTPLIPFPTTVSVTSIVTGNSPTTITRALSDLVTITKAEFHTLTRVLNIQATSSDSLGNPTLTVTNPPIGPMVGGLKTITTNIPPASVSVSSAAGGSMTVPVVVISP